MAIDAASYDHVIVAFSGGKDSVACVLHLLDGGIKPELWHHDVDGREGSRLMDWPCTRSYCEAFARAFGLNIYFSWKEGGFEREMLREDAPTARVHFEYPSEVGKAIGTAGGKSQRLNTRRKFPQVSANLKVRWCSSYLKIDVGKMALANQARFRNARTLFITGERAQESAARSKYKDFEPHRTDLRHSPRQRHIDHWRPVLHYTEEEVWDKLAEYRIHAHPAYFLGWGRCSCAGCIFNSDKTFSTLRLINPEQYNRLADYEEEFSLTMRRKKSLREIGTEVLDFDERYVPIALSATYDQPIILDTFVLPRGAFQGASCGPV